MDENRILIPVDFTLASDKAVDFGIALAEAGRSNITLLHVYEDGDMTPDECEFKLKSLTEKACSGRDILCDHVLEKGNIFNVIPGLSSTGAFRMVVMGTHGRRGLRQKFFGPDILKVIKKIPVPVLVVQEGARMPSGGFKTALFPVGSHDAYTKIIDAVIFIAGLFDPEVHLYSISKSGFEQGEKLRENIGMAEKSFSAKGIRYKRVKEDQKVFSVGFAKQSLNYAAHAGADLIAIMSNPTRENYYFADNDKEAILTNDLNIPVLCASNATVSV